jgi:hypothetical protein
MMDERERLGHVVQGFAPSDDAFERLVTRRGRRQRNRRIRAGALGVIVALAMGLVFARSVRTDGIPADRPEPRPAPAVVSGALAYGLDGEIWIADPDGSNAVRITDVGTLDDECPGELGYGLPSWSPDGRYLAFRGPQDPGCSSPTGVVITDAQGNVVASFPGQEQVIAMPPGWRQGDLGRLAWMPDGSSLIVDQYEVPLDGGAPRELPFPFTEFNSQPQRYSPDGSLVAYANRHGLMVARPDGSEPRAVFGPVGPYTWTWSLNGELIALTAGAPGDPYPWPPNELHVVDVATGTANLLFQGDRRTTFWVVGFSPDGDRVLFTTYEKSGPSSLWSVGIDGSDAHLVVEGTDDGAWRPV